MKVDRKFIERAAWYVFGVAIGLTLLGFVQMKRSQAHQQRLAQEQQRAVQATPGSASLESRPTNQEPSGR